ncbi:MAG: 2-oxo acid dehydrogenase subunit E2 [Chloroflexota bacterium]|nr:2-oxo acid dehydrogenase subunit E2 [Chloroflexota bacterium]
MPVDVKMPQLGESVVEGTIGRWLKQPGESIAKYEPLLEVTTDKVDTEVPSTIDGTVLELLVPEGETVRVGTIIARLSDKTEVRTVSQDQNGAGAERRAEQPSAAATAEPPTAPPPISPAVARLAAEHGVDLSRIRGTGTNGRVTKQDVERFVAAGPPAQEDETASVTPPDVITSPAPAPTQTSPTEERALQETVQSSPRDATEERLIQEQAPRVHVSPPPQAPAPETGAGPRLEPGDELVPLTAMRRAIAEHMVRSRRVAPHVTTVMEADLTRIAAHRERVKADYERQAARLTFTAYFVQAAVAALRSVPAVNASWTDEGIQIHNRLNIGVAVAVPEGLIVPVIKDADEKSLLGLARAVNDLAERARYRRLQPEETREGTFTITNHGVSGSLFATPIINQPQAAILGIGAIEKRPVVVTEGGLDAIAIRLRAYVSLTFDHRVLDGAAADGFLQRFKTALETFEG